LGLVFLLLLIAACGNSEESGDSVTARLLIEADASLARWFDDVTLPTGGNGYELLEAAVDGDLEAIFSEEFSAHFVTGILGEAPSDDAFWGLFVWNAGVERWELSVSAADLLTVDDGHIIAWAIIKFDPDNPQLPTSQP
jgi:hypothetical protein